MSQEEGLCETAAAVILAGGASGRMGRDKALLDVGGEPLIQHIYDQLYPRFAQVIVSAQRAGAYPFLSADIVVDEAPGRGPLEGIVSALEASAYDMNFVIACDIPDIRMDVVRRLLREAAHHEAVIPTINPPHLEPLCAVYRKCLAIPLRRKLRSGCRRILDALAGRDVYVVHLTDGDWLKNINTETDYHILIRRARGIRQ